MVKQSDKEKKLEEEAKHDRLEPHHRDRARESQILLWIWNALDEVDFGSMDFDQYLKDGVMLCRLMNVIKPNSIPGELKHNSIKDKKQNIEKFINAVAAYGVPKELLFQPEDLLLMTHIPRVIRCIFALGKKVEDDSNYKGPKLGSEPYEPVGKCGRRQGGLPLGDDIYVAHVALKNITDHLPIDGRQLTEKQKKRFSLYNF